MAYLDETGLAYYDGKLKDWIEGPNSDIAHRSGDETIEGVKTFMNTSPGHNEGQTVTDLILRNPEVVRGIPMDGGRSYTRIVLADAEGDTESTYAGRLGLLEVQTPMDGDTAGEHLNLGCYRFSADPSDYGKYADLQIGYDVNGIPYASVPAISDERDGSADIVTRGWRITEAEIDALSA